jgi:hypothetical protein
MTCQKSSKKLLGKLLGKVGEEVKEMDGKDNGNPTLNTFPILTHREAKGYTFEVDVQNILYTLGFKLQGNPVSEYVWKHENIRRRADITLANGVKIECKNIDGKVYLSWFKRDWLPKGNCVFVFKGDLKLSPAIIEKYHPILVHYSLLHLYLTHKHPLLCTVTSLLEAIPTKNVETKKYLFKTLQLKSFEGKVQAKTCELSTSEKCLPDESINLEVPNKLSTSRDSVDAFARREHLPFHYKVWRGES